MTLAFVVRTLLVAALLALLAFVSFVVPLRVVAASPVAVAGTFPFDGLSRSYRLFRPATLAHQRPVPLVVVLHGGFGSGRQAEKSYHWDDAAMKHGFVVLYPDGIGRSWNAGDCCGPSQRRNLDDVGFLSALIEQIARDQNVDRERIFVTGISNGAMMAYRMACEAPLTIAAIGPVAGTLGVPCERARPTSLLAIHGLADENVPFEGGVPQKGVTRNPRLAVPVAIERWHHIDACAQPVSRKDGSVAYSQASCAQGRTVELVTIAGAGHQWPGGAAPPAWAELLLQLDEPSTALDATTLLWSFFATHPA